MLEVQDKTPSPCGWCGDPYNAPARAEWDHTNPDCPKYKRWKIKNGGVPPMDDAPKSGGLNYPSDDRPQGM